ncbi:hypothetical protein PAXINDRAFT_100963, partial [Paxillus involutus ATCC 200175]
MTAKSFPILLRFYFHNIPHRTCSGEPEWDWADGRPARLDAAAREDIFASFAAFFQEVQNLHDEPHEDPERANKHIPGHVFFPGDTSAFLLVLMLGTAMPMLIGLFAI